MAEPILKWAGGKKQILGKLKQIITKDMLQDSCYYEPFVGGGSLVFELEPASAVINDYNNELINVYIQTKIDPEGLIELLMQHKERHNKEYYYYVRALDRTEGYKELSGLEKAARTIYLNRTCFNGLYRVNRQNQFNVPIGNYSSPDIVRASQIRGISDYLNKADVKIMIGDFANAVAEAKAGDVIYFDPPYDYDIKPEEEGFIRYTQDQFYKKDLLRMKDLCDDLLDKGCYVIVSNNDTKYVRDLFENENYKFQSINGRRMINNTSIKRHGVEEVLIYGYRG